MTDDTITPDRPDRIEPVDLQVEMQRSYLDYAMSVIVGRALPDVRDGLKPVHRRVLYAMYDGGYRPDRGFSKCARVVGDVMGSLPPARRLRDLRHLGPPHAGVVAALPAGPRPGQLRLAGQRPRGRHALHRVPARPLAMEMMRDIDEETVDFAPELRRPHAGAAASCRPVPQPARQRQRRHRRRHGHQHPAAQPARGRARRAVGARAPGGHPRGAARAALMERIKGPDFPTGGLIVGRRASRTPTAPAAGSITMRAVVEVRGDPRPHVLVVTELPYQVNPDNLCARSPTWSTTARSPGIADVDRRVQRRRPAPGDRAQARRRREVVLNNLYKHTQLQDTFGCNMLALVDGVPRTLPLDEFVRHWIAHQVEVIQRRTRYPAAQGRGARPHPARLRQGARPARRGHRADPRDPPTSTRRAPA